MVAKAELAQWDVVDAGDREFLLSVSEEAQAQGLPLDAVLQRRGGELATLEAQRSELGSGSALLSLGKQPLEEQPVPVLAPELEAYLDEIKVSFATDFERVELDT